MGAYDPNRQNTNMHAARGGGNEKPDQKPPTTLGGTKQNSQDNTKMHQKTNKTILNTPMAEMRQKPEAVPKKKQSTDAEQKEKN